MSLDKTTKLSLTCRICASLITDTSLIPLYFSVDPIEGPPIFIINKYTNNLLQIEENDNLPQQVCIQCLETFYTMNDFLDKTIKIQKKLQNICNENGVVESVEIELLSSEEIKNQIIGNQEIEVNDAECYLFESSDIESSDLESCKSSDSEYFIDNFKEDFRFICHICKTELKTAYLLDRHVNKIHINKNDDNILCENCGKKIHRKIYLRHIKYQDCSISYQCRYCYAEFANQKSLLQHYNSKPINCQNINKGYPYTCPSCRRKFRTLVFMQKHQIVWHNAKREQNPRYKPNTCNYCGRVYSRSDHLKGHIKQVHLNIMDHPCLKCGKKYSAGYKLNHHIRISHAEKQSYKCEYCSKVYKNATRFSEHVSEHSKEPKFKCILCGLLFHKMSALKKHEITHEKEEVRSLELQIKSDNTSQINQIENTLEDEDDFEMEFLTSEPFAD